MATQDVGIFYKPYSLSRGRWLCETRCDRASCAALPLKPQDLVGRTPPVGGLLRAFVGLSASGRARCNRCLPGDTNGDRKVNKINSFTAAFAAFATIAAGIAHATLPPAPEAAKATAAEAAAKSAWSDKVGAYQLCLAQDRIAETYRKDLKGSGKAAPTPVSTAACQDPGPFVTPVAQKPLEASGAHSPPGTATSPPSTKATAAETMGSKKP